MQNKYFICKYLYYQNNVSTLFFSFADFIMTVKNTNNQGIHSLKIDNDYMLMKVHKCTEIYFNTIINCRTDHYIVTFNFTFCESPFLTQKDLEEHVLECHNAKYHKCWCGKTFFTSTELDTHVSDVHKLKVHRCHEIEIDSSLQFRPFSFEISSGLQ